MYPRIPWELVADHLESAVHTLGTTGMEGYASAEILISRMELLGAGVWLLLFL
jgi:hypothetical protein